MKTALITGITGQDGSYLAELLLDKGYAVHGIIRRSSSFNTARIDRIFDKVTLHYGDVTDPGSLGRIIGTVKPDEVYNLAAQSHVKVSFEQPSFTSIVNTQGALNVLEAVRDYRDATGHEVRVYQASSSEMFGSSPPPQNEATPFRPCSPYGVSKVAAFHWAVNFRESYGLFVANGILFNHESPRRGETFVTRKITRAATRIAAGLQSELVLGNLYAKRDWGFAGDYVEAMWRMLQQEKPDDFCIGTGQSMEVRKWVDMTFHMCGLRKWAEFVRTDERYLRPTEVNALQADATKARNVLGWVPQATAGALCRLMVECDTQLAERELALKNAGHAPSLVSC